MKKCNETHKHTHTHTYTHNSLSLLIDRDELTKKQKQKRNYAYIFSNSINPKFNFFYFGRIICSRLNSSGAWRHSMSRDLGTDIDSIFSSRTGATLPRGEYLIK